MQKVVFLCTAICLLNLRIFCISIISQLIFISKSFLIGFGIILKKNVKDIRGLYNYQKSKVEN